MSNPAEMIDSIYLTIDGGRTFVQASEAIHLTAHPGGAVAADGGVQPSDPVTDDRSHQIPAIRSPQG
jgi:hypothetical protein